MSLTRVKDYDFVLTHACVIIEGNACYRSNDTVISGVEIYADLQ